MWSSNLYLSMSFYFACEGFDGFAHWMKKQSQEELEHAYTMADYVTKRGGKAKVDKIDVVPQGWGSPLEVFQHVYEHECKVSKMIDNLVSIASVAPLGIHTLIRGLRSVLLPTALLIKYFIIFSVMV